MWLEFVYAILMKLLLRLRTIDFQTFEFSLFVVNTYNVIDESFVIKFQTKFAHQLHCHSAMTGRTRSQTTSSLSAKRKERSIDDDVLPLAQRNNSTVTAVDHVQNNVDNNPNDHEEVEEDAEESTFSRMCHTCKRVRDDNGELLDMMSMPYAGEYDSDGNPIYNRICGPCMVKQDDEFRLTRPPEDVDNVYETPGAIPMPEELRQEKKGKIRRIPWRHPDEGPPLKEILSRVALEVGLQEGGRGDKDRKWAKIIDVLFQQK